MSYKDLSSFSLLWFYFRWERGLLLTLAPIEFESSRLSIFFNCYLSGYCNFLRDLNIYFFSSSSSINF